jgi:hypothetical protein
MKETFYFPHDYNPRSDDKIKPLIRKHGMLGYGVFWAIIEDLYNNANALRTDYECIAFELRVDEKVVKSIINDFDLFVKNGNFFGSMSVQKRLEERNAKSKKARESALNRWVKDANVMQPQCDRMEKKCEGNAIKEKKGKERKIIKEYPPEIISLNDACKKYFNEKYVGLKSLECFDKLTRLDGYTIIQIKQAILNARGDPFWEPNFQSPVKLRDKDKNGVLYIDKFLKIQKNATNKPSISKTEKPEGLGEFKSL